MSRLFHARKKMQALLADYVGGRGGAPEDEGLEEEGSES